MKVYMPFFLQPNAENCCGCCYDDYPCNVFGYKLHLEEGVQCISIIHNERVCLFVYLKSALLGGTYYWGA
jgi:hypothetical protein